MFKSSDVTLVRQKRGLCSCALALLCASACAGSADVQQERQLLASWSASAALTAGRWRLHQVPTFFTRDALATAEKALQQEQQAVATIRAPGPRHTLAAALDTLRTAVAALQQDVGSDHRSSAVARATALAGMASRLQSSQGSTR